MSSAARRTPTFDDLTLVAVAREADVARLPPFDVEMALDAWWKRPAAATP